MLELLREGFGRPVTILYGISQTSFRECCSFDYGQYYSAPFLLLPSMPFEPFGIVFDARVECHGPSENEMLCYCVVIPCQQMPRLVGANH